MSKELDIDSKTELWIPAFKSASLGESPSCPRCGSNNVDVIAKRCGGDIGFVLITCNNCNKTGYFSRVDFSNYSGKVEQNI